MGYPFGKKGWKLYDLKTREIFVSRDVIFYENIFPFSNEKDETTSYDIGEEVDINSKKAQDL